MGQGSYYQKERIIWGSRDLPFGGWGKRRGRVFIFFLWGGWVERTHRTYYLTGVDQKSPGWLIMFVGEVETAVDQVLHLGFVPRTFSMSDTILGLRFSL